MWCFTTMITFYFYFNNYFLFSNCFSPLQCHLNLFLFLCSCQIGENNHFNFSPSNHFLFSCFSFVCLFFARRLFCLIGVNLRAVVMTSEVNELLLTITHSLVHAHTQASTHLCKHAHARMYSFVSMYVQCAEI